MRAKNTFTSARISYNLFSSRYLTDDFDEGDSEESKENQRPKKRPRGKSWQEELDHLDLDFDESARASFQPDTEISQPRKRRRKRPSRLSSESQEMVNLIYEKKTEYY